jgi:hypothetical protein
MQTRARARIVLLGAVSIAALLVAACGSSDGNGRGAPPSSSPSGSSLSGSVVGDPIAPTKASDVASTNDECADAAASADAGYFTCSSPHDCVAVRFLANCCYNGWKIAVARDEAEAYIAATTCAPNVQHLCPEYVVVDTRVPACDMADHTCIMVEPSQTGSSDHG